MMRTVPVRLSAMVIIPSVLAPAPGVYADETPKYGTHLPLPGASSRLVLVSGNDVPDEAFGAFLNAAGDVGTIVILANEARTTAEVHGVQQGLEIAGGPDVLIVDANRVDDWSTIPSVVWIVGDIGPGFEAAAARGGSLIGASHGAMEAVAAHTVPGFLIFDGVDDEGAIERCHTSNLVGLEVPPGAFIGVLRRRARTGGDADVTVHMRAGNRRDAMAEHNPPGTTLDLIQLSRAAVARAHDLIPGETCDEPWLERGTLLIGGGGGLTQAMMERWVLAGGGADGKFVVIPTAIGNRAEQMGQGDVRRLRNAGATDVTMLHVTTPEEAEDEAFLAPLRDATGVWFSGGRQWRLVDSYANTEAHKLMHDVLARGGAIGGSSAGASIQAEYMVRGHPLGNTVMMAEGYERGLGFLPGVAIDQHFTQRGRLADLAAVKSARPQLLCIGIDESTVIFVTGGVMEVMGEHRVLVYDDDPASVDGEPAYTVITAGERYDMVAREKVD